jgi:WD40 repeat protein
MGVVFKARQLGVKRVVALKMLASGAAAGHDFVHRFHNEAEAAARLDHPHIVPIYEFGEHDGTHYLAMQYMEGGTLQARIAKGLPSPNETARWLLPLAQAVDHAHKRGVLHRDLKPGNVLLDAEGVPRVSDFGLARIIEVDSSLTVSQTVLGTAAYLAPEVAMGGAGRATTASDIYGLGAILYEALTGRPPFAADSFPALLRRQAEEAPVLPRSLNPAVPHDLETICLKCLEKEPARRYLSAQELAEDLARFLAAEPIQARPIPWLERAWRWCVRKPALAGLGLTTLALLLVLAVGAPVAAYRIERERRQAQLHGYTSDMNLALEDWREGNLTQARSLLRRYLPGGQRTIDAGGFEWRYLWNLCRDQSLRSFTDFDGAVYFAWIPGQYAVAAANGHVVRRIDLKSGVETDLLRDSEDVICSLAFCPGATNLLATGGEATVVKLWDLTSGKIVAKYSGHLGPVTSLAFSADGQRLASAADFGFQVMVSDVRGGTNVWIRKTAVPAHVVMFTPDGQQLVSGGSVETGNIQVWDMQGDATAFPAEHSGWVYRLSFSPDGKLLASESSDSTTILWDFAARKSLHRFSGSGPATFSPDSRLLAIGGSTFHVWEVATAREIGSFSGHEADLTCLDFSPDGQQLVSSSYDGTLKVWSLGAKPVVETLRGHSNWIAGLTFSPDGRRLASVNHHTNFYTRIWDVATRQPLTNLVGLKDRSGGTQFSPDGKMLATASIDGIVQLWNAHTYEFLFALTNDFDGGTTAFSRNSQILGVVRPGLIDRGGLAFWDVPSQRRLAKLNGFGTKARSVIFGNRSDLVAIGYYDGTVRVWNFPTEQLLCEFRQHTEAVLQLALTQDDTLLASAGRDGLVGLYDLRRRASLPPLAEHSGGVWSVAFTPDGKTLASGSVDSTIKLWNVAAGQAALTLRGHHGAVTGVAFSPDGQLLASSDAQGSIRLWPAPLLKEGNPH